MTYLAERRGEEKARRRAEIIDVAEALYAEKDWDAVTVEHVARSARLSRTLVYLYFSSKDELLFAIGERALSRLGDCVKAAVVGSASNGLEKVEAIVRAYIVYARDFPHYFNFCSRFRSRSMSQKPSSNESACYLTGDQGMAGLVEAIELGNRDGSIPATVDNPTLFAIILWAFIHGIIQTSIAKGRDLARAGIAIPDFNKHAFDLLRAIVASRST
jgi:AcrR family transcriptional regulator